MRVRNTESEGSADEVLQGETHNLSPFSAGARVFCYRCNDVSPPLSRAALQQCHKCLLATLLQDEPRMSRCAASVYITRVTVCHSALPVTSPRIGPEVCGQPLPGSHVNHKHQIISKDFRKGV